ncbi:MAG: diguanylate cyclase [bacterium]|nr:diguanylate cyclase [bacterium]
MKNPVFLSSVRAVSGYIKAKPPSQIMGLSLFMILVLGALDYCTGYEISFSIFYFIPILIVSWYTSLSNGVIISFLSAVVWGIVDYFSGHTYSYILIPVWNTLMRLFIYFIITYLITTLKKSLNEERKLAREDHLTRTWNSRYFLEIGEIETKRAFRYRHDLTLVYLDLDDFKKINDRYGHLEGDRCLALIAETIKKNLRIHDVLARLGGDEFAILFPETSQRQARSIVKKIRTHVKALMTKNRWPVTLSIGVTTCSKKNCDIETLIRKTDEVMYSIKRKGKDNAAFIRI